MGFAGRDLPGSREPLIPETTQQSNTPPEVSPSRGVTHSQLTPLDSVGINPRGNNDVAVPRTPPRLAAHPAAQRKASRSLVEEQFISLA